MKLRPKIEEMTCFSSEIQRYCLLTAVLLYDDGASVGSHAAIEGDPSVNLFPINNVASGLVQPLDKIVASHSLFLFVRQVFD